MSRLEELIQQHCPNGVEYVRFVDYANVLYGYPFIITLHNPKSVIFP